MKRHIISQPVIKDLEDIIDDFEKSASIREHAISLLNLDSWFLRRQP